MKANLTLKAKLAILSAIPLCCAIALGFYLAYERTRELNEFTSFEEAMGLANLLAEVNEANNAELGNAWCWTPTCVEENGIEVVQNVRDTWNQNGKDVDAAYETLLDYKNGLDLSKFDAGFAKILDRVDAAYETLAPHRNAMRQTMDYNDIIQPYVAFKQEIQSLYPALLKETNDMDLAQKLSAYNVYLDYHSAAVQYIGVMIWAHQIPELPPGGYSRYESYYRESETLLKHFRNLAPANIVAEVDAILESANGRWVDEKVKSFLTANDTWHDFTKHASLEAEFKQKGEGRNVELGEIMLSIRDDIMAYTTHKIEQLAFNRNLAYAIILVIFAASISFNLVFSSRISKLIMEITRGIANGASHVTAAARQITQASENLAQSSCLQASHVEETTSMIARILEMTNATTSDAEAATRMIQNTSQVIEESSKTMEEMNRSIGQIAANSEETKKIMGTITDIAFQTNILALNAAVEAARAGESGAGFAVVADEVRTLAQRSSNASENTNSLIESSNSNIHVGTQAATRANEAFSKVLESAQSVFTLINEINRHASQQASAIHEINQAAEKVDQTTQSNAASAEECAASASSLNSQARILDDYVDRLKQMVYGSARAQQLRFDDQPQQTPSSKNSFSNFSRQSSKSEAFFS